MIESEPTNMVFSETTKLRQRNQVRGKKRRRLRGELRRRERERFYFRLKSVVLMGRIAKRFILTQPEATERDLGSAADVKFVPLSVNDLKLAFDADASVVLDGDLYRWHTIPSQ
jgi:hypothetical protein